MTNPWHESGRRPAPAMVGAVWLLAVSAGAAFWTAVVAAVVAVVASGAGADAAGTVAGAAAASSVAALVLMVAVGALAARLDGPRAHPSPIASLAAARVGAATAAA